MRTTYAEIRRQGDKLFRPGNVVTLMPDAIHSVVNETGAVTVSLHTYGRHLNYTEHLEIDPDRNTAGPVTRKVRRAG